jgi:geranylgeranyl pyrophosphate synthase
VDIFEQIIDYFSKTVCPTEWGEVKELFCRVASGKPYQWMLPVWGCEAVGGSLTQAIPTATAIACSQISIILVDDMLDEDPRGEYRLVGAPGAANMACAFQSLGQLAITQCEAGLKIKLAAQSVLNRMMFTTAFGQHQDVQCPGSEADYWRVVQTKSSPFFGSALQIGGLIGGGTEKVVEGLKTLGQLYGEMIQIHDDLNDALEVPANPDWTSGRTSLPILFAETVGHPDRQRFVELRRKVQDPQMLTEAQTILISCGAISYGVDQLVQRYKKCLEILASLSLIDSTGLEHMLDKVVEPVNKLFNALGMTQPLFPPMSRRSSPGTSGGSNPR